MESTVLVKAFALLEALGGSGEGQSLATLADHTRLKRPTAHRVLTNLVDLGYVQRLGEGVYRIGAKARCLAAPEGRRHLLAAAEPHLQMLHRRTGETVNLGVLRGNEVEYVIVLESVHPLRRMVQAGSTDPFYCTALGRVLVAALPVVDQQRLLARIRLIKRTRHTLIDRELLRRALQSANRAGFAVERDQTDLGVTCIAAPIFQNGQVAAAVSLSAPTARAGDDSIRQLSCAVVRAAKQMSRALAKPRS